MITQIVDSHGYIAQMVVWREWRRPNSELAWGAAAFSVCFVFLLGFGLRAEATPRSWTTDTAIVVACLLYTLLSGILMYRVFAHARLVATPEGLLISNPFRADQEIAWKDIASMKADRLLWIHGTDGERRIAWVIQKNGWSRARVRRTDADDAITEMGVLAGRALGAGPIDFTAA